MDWASVTFGAFLGVAGTFGMLALALFPIMRRGFLVWIALRTLAFCVMGLALFPLELPDWFPSGAARVDIGEIALSLAVACTGPFLAAYLEDEPRLARARFWLTMFFPIGLASGAATALAPWWGWMDRVHDVLILSVILMLVATLAFAVRTGSRAARFQAVGYAPLIVVGLVVLTYELSTGTPMPYWPVAALFAVTVDFIVTGVGVIDGFMIIKRQRDAAVADVREARIAVATDPLTNIANRRGLALRFRDQNQQRPRGLAVIDCDHFKRVNDMFGHDVGDEVLIAVADGLRHEDVFPARQGGEEFVVLIYGNDWQRLAETVRRRITISVLELVPEVSFPVTASAGLTEIAEHDTLDSAMKRADRALFAAKDAGRDRLLVESECGTIGPHLLHSVV
ncbi:GGDEF domain-containing protein [Qipengyuania flava]|uniref:GGDEF domain-containing protein n=1 Tax=Qipengyuania flava TaxID=192812 RepID=UPI001C62E2B7|nr:GGDEF domain-containing protein [Qipengyuania flava]QYJ06728.1 GGDEF domain-containing protein [Qipengyuania flava]